jgi:hypothetical protein
MNDARRALAAAALMFVTATASAAVILNNASTGRYNNAIGMSLDTAGATDPFPCANVACQDQEVAYPTAPDLSAAGATLGNWLTNPAAPGGAWGPAGQFIPLTWAVNTETAIIYEIDAGIGLTNLELLLGVDNGVFVWLDGVYQFGARRSGGASPNEYPIGLPDLATGTHYLQILREDHGGGTGFDISLTGDRARIAAVPVPATLALFGIGLAGLALTQRRRT